MVLTFDTLVYKDQPEGRDDHVSIIVLCFLCESSGNHLRNKEEEQKYVCR